MRISDWSSDVCSSDLEIERRSEDFLDAEVADTGKPRAVAAHIDVPRGASNFRMFADIVTTLPTESFGTPTPDGSGAINYAVRKPKDRKSVVYGKSVSVRVDTGGRRLIKKKKIQ